MLHGLLTLKLVHVLDAYFAIQLKSLDYLNCVFICRLFIVRATLGMIVICASRAVVLSPGNSYSLTTHHTFLHYIPILRNRF